jgi:hypothetical protein
MTSLLLALLLATAPAPEECLAKKGVAVSFGGKTYQLASEACREQFLSDPERYSQLYDALLEMQAGGAAISSAPASSVPS